MNDNDTKQLRQIVKEEKIRLLINFTQPVTLSVLCDYPVVDQRHLLGCSFMREMCFPFNEMQFRKRKHTFYPMGYSHFMNRIFASINKKSRLFVES
jgi:hypothetical protein